MRRLLFLAHRIPFPPDKGDKIRSFHMLRYLSTRFEVHLGCFMDRKADEKHIEELRKYCADVFCLRLERRQVATRALRAAVLGQSISESFYHDARMARWVNGTLARHPISDVFVFCSVMAPYVVPAASGRRLVLDMVDVDSEKWSAYGRSASSFLRPVFRREQRRVFALESRAGAASNRILFVSGAEASTFAGLAPALADRVAYIDNGVDSVFFDPHRDFPNPFAPDALPIVFTGAMDYRANADAVAWFARACFPEIRAAHPQAEFWIVGANPPPAVRRLGRRDGIFVTGCVEDMRPFLAHAACAVAPMRIARGVQNKVLEAMAMARPVVVTPCALEGILARPGRELLVADGANNFVLRVSEILSGECRGIGPAARLFVIRNHDWTDNLQELDRIFEEPCDAEDATHSERPAQFAVGTR